MPRPCRPALIVSLCALAACTSGAAPQEIDRIVMRGESYPVRVAEDGSWNVLVDGMAMPCRTPTMEDCSWALRHRLEALDALDQPGTL